MEVIQILNSQMENLTKEEIKFLIDELNTGSYDEEYKQRCFSLIEIIKKKKKNPTIDNASKKPKIFQILMTPDDIKNRIDTSTLSLIDKFLHELQIGRTVNTNVDVIEHYIKNNLLDKEYFLSNIEIFNQADELKMIFKLLQLEEVEVEKYFNIAPKGIMEEYQFISEDFFIKYFDKISITLLKKNKITPWVYDSSFRSYKIKIFIKMKGINL